jgi:hypothetical protein
MPAGESGSNESGELAPAGLLYGVLLRLDLLRRYGEREQLLREGVLRDWDPACIRERTERWERKRRLIADWVRAVNPTEPDLPGFPKKPRTGWTRMFVVRPGQSIRDCPEQQVGTLRA